MGVAGLGGASRKILPCFHRLSGIDLVAAADLREEARRQFHAVYNRPTFQSVEEMCQKGGVDAVYVATPTHLHYEHTITAFRYGKHVICEKPLAVTLQQCDEMIDAASAAGLQLLQGQSKVFDSPVRMMRQVIESGHLGMPIQLDTWNFNDWMLRPRLQDELDTSMGGGVVYRQSPMQIEIARYLLGGTTVSVNATTGKWNKFLNTEGNYAAQIEFNNNRVASISYNGYGYMNIGELLPFRNTLECLDNNHAPYASLKGPATPQEKYDKSQADYESHNDSGRVGQPFCGLTIVSCEQGIIRQSCDGLYVYTSTGRHEVKVPEDIGRSAGLIELRDALLEGRTAWPDGKWGRSTLEICLAILESSRTGRKVDLVLQQHI